MEGACPNTWTTAYASYHADVMAGRLPPRYLVHTCDAGFADCAVGAVTALYLAVLSRRALCIGRHTPQHFFRPGEPSAHLDAVFEQPSINWTMDDARWHSHTVSKSFQMGGMELQSDKVSSFLDDGACGDNSTEVFFLNSNAGLVHKLVDHPRYAAKLSAMGSTIDNALGCGLDFLFAPKAAVLARVQPQMNELRQQAANACHLPILAVHLRTGDADNFERRSHSDVPRDISGPTDCIENIRSHIDSVRAKHVQPGGLCEAVATNKSRLFIISDNVQVRRALKHRYPDATIKMDTKPEHSFRQADNITLAGLELAAGEFWLFRMADYHIITIRSGFGRAAAVAGPSQHPDWRPGHLLDRASATEKRAWQHSDWAKGCGKDDALTQDDMVSIPPGV